MDSMINQKSNKTSRDNLWSHKFICKTVLYKRIGMIPQKKAARKR